MPHKVNPIRFENAEANLEVSSRPARSARLDARHLAPAARPHRLHHPAQHRRRLRPLAAGDRERAARPGGPGRRPGAMVRDLDANWEVLAEAVQSVMRVHGLEQPYERLKELTRGRRIDAAGLRDLRRDTRPPHGRPRPAARPDAGHLHRPGRRARRAFRRRSRLRLAGIRSHPPPAAARQAPTSPPPRSHPPPGAPQAATSRRRRHPPPDARRHPPPEALRCAPHLSHLVRPGVCVPHLSAPQSIRRGAPPRALLRLGDGLRRPLAPSRRR